MDYYVMNSELKKTEVYDTYWRFACERQHIFHERMMDCPYSTTDGILKKYKFTNAYRASDRVSQYLIKNVIYDKRRDDKDTLFRILFFKIFNRIETWERIEEIIGDINYTDFSIDRYSDALEKMLSENLKLYSGAYIMPSGKSCFGFEKKYRNHLALLDLIMKENVFEKIKSVSDLEELYRILLELPTIGRFLAFQYAIDINYSDLTDFSEMDYVVAGPGALSGIKKCFENADEYTPEYLIEYMAYNQEAEFLRLGLMFEYLGGRKLQLIDCQNLFCETDKYARVKHPNVKGTQGRSRIKQLYRRNNKDIEYYYPPKWGINDRLITE